MIGIGPLAPAGRRPGRSAAARAVAEQVRINALGEMASGLTHELTQPLTAILAQAQAGKRLAAQERAVGYHKMA